jgi:hypothetical protein
MLRDYDHGGSVDLRIDAIEDAVCIPYSSNRRLDLCGPLPSTHGRNGYIAPLGMMMERNSDFGQECPPYPGGTPGTAVQG